MSNPMQPLDPAAAPPPVTPAGTPSSPLFEGVTPHGQGPAPYDIQAPVEDLGSVFAAAGAASAGDENDVYPQGPRQAQAEAVLASPPGYGAFSITAGWHGGGGDGWPADVSPGANAETPDQGHGDFTGTGTD